MFEFSLEKPCRTWKVRNTDSIFA